MPKPSKSSVPATISRDRDTGAIKVRDTLYSLGEISRGARVSRPHVTRIFNGKRGLSLRVAEKIASFLGVSIDSLLGFLKG